MRAAEIAADLLASQQQTQRLLHMGIHMRRQAPGVVPGKQHALLHYGLAVQQLEVQRCAGMLRQLAPANDAAIAAADLTPA